MTVPRGVQRLYHCFLLSGQQVCRASDNMHRHDGMMHHQPGWLTVCTATMPVHLVAIAAAKQQ
jgi:hypothetical protein